MDEIATVKSFLDFTFKIKDLGPLHYFLSLEFQRSSVCQTKFTLDLLKEFDCSNFTAVVSPLDINNKLYHDHRTLLSDPSLYRKLEGKLNFLTQTRPDISFSVQHLSQFMASPRQPHWNAAIHVLRYLKNNPAQGLFFNSNPTFDTSSSRLKIIDI